MKRSKTDMLVWHCTATREGEEVTKETITKWHLDRGFSDIGYHIIVHLDGSIELGRPIDQAGAHAKGYNYRSIGACYVGGFDKHLQAKDTRTPEQKIAMRAITTLLCEIYPIKHVIGHRDLSVDLNEDGAITPDEWMKACPSFSVAQDL